MLPIVWLIGLILGIALTWLGVLASRNGALYPGIILIFSCGAFVLTWFGLYVHSCMVVADLKSFNAAEKQNYEMVTKQVKNGIDWQKLSQTGLYGQAKTIETFGLTVNDYIEKVRWYNEELGRLKDFNENIWIDLIFKSLPADLKYILLEEE